VRAKTYARERRLQVFPPSLLKRWELDPPPIGSRKLEIGSGWNPQPGYIHVDVDPQSRHLHFRTPGHRIPLADGWADEILSIHMIEHIPPPMLAETLSEWHRVLRPDGLLEVHTPNGQSLANALTLEPALFWAAQSAIYGYSVGPTVAKTPENLGSRGDHRTLLTFRVVESLLARAGFVAIEDASDEDACFHSREWSDFIPGLCLEVRARKPSLPKDEVG
jgi:SAM-dependent methyltransferase